MGSLSFRLYVIGGEGISALSELGLATNDIDAVKKIIADYTKKLSVEYSVPTDFMSGSLAAFYPALATYDFGRYNRFIGEAYLAVGDLAAKRDRVRQILSNSDDWGLTDAELTTLQGQYDKIGASLSAIEDRALDCRSLHDGALAALASKQLKIRSTCVIDANLVTMKISWPSDRPYRLSYWVDDLTTAPQVFMYVDIKGPKIATAQVIGADGSTVAVLNILSDGITKKALSAIEYSKLSDAQKPLTLKVTTESGTEYTSALPYSRTAPVSGVAVASASKGVQPLKDETVASPASLPNTLLIRNGVLKLGDKPTERIGDVVIAPREKFR